MLSYSHMASPAPFSTSHPPLEPHAEQLLLCDDWVDADPLKAAKLMLMELKGSKHSPRTLEAYASDYRHFAAWCTEKKLCSLPCHPETLALYVSDLVGKFAASTIERRVAAIAAEHGKADLMLPITPLVRAVVGGLRRKNMGRVRRMAAITIPELAQVLEHIGEGRDGRDRTRRTVRDRAALTLGFAGAYRRSEIIGLDLADIDLGRDRLQISIGRSKTDQSARGRVLVIPKARRANLCAVRLMAKWLQVRGDEPGPLFYDMTGADELIIGKRMASHTVYFALHEGAKRAGMDPKRFGAHSLRAGAVTAAADAGVDIFTIMELTGHRSVETVAKYVRRSVPRYALAKVM